MNAVADPLAGQAVTVGAIVFTDLVGFTEYNDAVGDQAAAEVLDRQGEMVGHALSTCRGGRLVKEIGDGLMLAFDSPVEALDAAVCILRSVEQARAAGTFPLAMRMGMHHGAAVVRGDDLIGHTVNIAARVAALAGPGELLVSDSVLGAAGGHQPEAMLSPIGPARVKGVHDPVWLHRVTAR
jgi:adenylate cyclase